MQTARGLSCAVVGFQQARSQLSADWICGEVDLEMDSAEALAPPRCLRPDPVHCMFPHVNRHFDGLLGWLDRGRAERSTSDFSKSNVGFCPNDLLLTALPSHDKIDMSRSPIEASEMSALSNVIARVLYRNAGMEWLTLNNPCTGR
jgi:hypothetical protein